MPLECHFVGDILTNDIPKDANSFCLFEVNPGARLDTLPSNLHPSNFSIITFLEAFAWWKAETM